MSSQETEETSTPVLKRLLSEVSGIFTISKPVFVTLMAIAAAIFIAGGFWASRAQFEGKLLESIENNSKRLSLVEGKLGEIERGISALQSESKNQESKVGAYIENQRRLLDQISELEKRLNATSDKLNYMLPLVQIFKEQMVVGKITDSDGTRVYTKDELGEFFEVASRYIEEGQVLKIRGGTWVATTGQCIGAPTNCAAIDLRDAANRPARFEMVYGDDAQMLAEHLSGPFKDYYLRLASAYPESLCAWASSMISVNGASR